MRNNRRKTPMVVLERLVCPKCQSVDVATTHTIESGEELVSQWRRCRKCRHVFIAHFLHPLSKNWTTRFLDRVSSTQLEAFHEANNRTK
jgi:hypothetical protein